MDKKKIPSIPDNYTSRNGERKSMTTIDHDIKTKISTGSIDIEEIRKALKEHREYLIQRILEFPPSVWCPYEFQDFVKRGDIANIGWDEVMLKDEGLDLDKLRTLHTLLSNYHDSTRIH